MLNIYMLMQNIYATVACFSFLCSSVVLADNTFNHPTGILIKMADLQHAKSYNANSIARKMVIKCDESLDQKSEAPNTFTIANVGTYTHPGIIRGQLQNSIMHDSAAAMDHAICWNLTNNQLYANHAAYIISSWMKTKYPLPSDHSDARLLINFGFPSMVLAADLLRGSKSWDSADDKQFKQLLSKNILPLSYAQYHQLNEANNFDASGLYFESVIRVYLQDRVHLQELADRWTQVISATFNDFTGSTLDLCRNSAGPIPGGKPNPWCAGTTAGENGLYYQSLTLNGYEFAEVVLENAGFNLKKTHADSIFDAVYCKTATWVINETAEPYYSRLVKQGLTLEASVLYRSAAIYHDFADHSCSAVTHVARAVKNPDPFPSIPFEPLFFDR